MAIKAIRTKDDEPNIAATQLKILVDGDSFEELQSLDTRNKVLTFARSIGFAVSGLSTVPHPYPVDADGKTNEKMFKDPVNNPWDHWQAEYEVNAGIR